MGLEKSCSTDGVIGGCFDVTQLLRHFHATIRCNMPCSELWRENADPSERSLFPLVLRSKEILCRFLERLIGFIHLRRNCCRLGTYTFLVPENYLIV